MQREDPCDLAVLRGGSVVASVKQTPAECACLVQAIGTRPVIRPLSHFPEALERRHRQAAAKRQTHRNSDWQWRLNGRLSLLRQE